MSPCVLCWILLTGCTGWRVGGRCVGRSYVRMRLPLIGSDEKCGICRSGSLSLCKTWLATIIQGSQGWTWSDIHLASIYLKFASNLDLNCGSGLILDWGISKPSRCNYLSTSAAQHWSWASQLERSEDSGHDKRPPLPSSFSTSCFSVISVYNEPYHQLV